MGNWNITIRGLGVHHNKGSVPEDANRMAARFVQDLKDAGHSVHQATVTYGGTEGTDNTDDISAGDGYLKQRDAAESMPAEVVAAVGPDA